MTLRRIVPSLASIAIAGAIVADVGEGVARAQSTVQSGTAEELFAEGRRLLVDGRVDEACAKLAQSQRIEPSAGTLLNLADCYERQGRLATAWLSFKEAAGAAIERKRSDWQRLAEKRADTLAPRVPHLRVVFSEGGSVPGLMLAVDGTTLAADVANTPIPVDPGPHTIRASAPGHRPRASSVTVEVGTTMKTVTFDALEREEVAPSGEPRTPVPPPPATLRTTGWVLSGIGVASLAAAGITALVANGALSDAKSACPTYPSLGPSCPPSVESDNARASSFATVSTVTAVVGATLVVTGVILLLAAPSAARSPSARALPWSVTF